MSLSGHATGRLRLQRAEWAVLFLALLLGGMLAALSVLRYTGYNASMLDIGDMAQSLWSGTQGRPLEYSVPLQDIPGRLSISRLAVHVELVYFLLVPPYALLPDPRTLLVLQALWFGLGAWPAYRLALRHLESRGWALGLAGMYLLYPVAQTAVLFDFHGDTLAMPPLLFALEALDRRAWRSYALWLALALSCKFYVGAAVAALGVVVWWRGERRAGLLTFLAGTGWLVLTLGVIKPLFAPPIAAGSNTTVAGYVQFYFGGMGAALLGTALPRLLTAAVVFTPALWLGRHAARWCLPALAVAAPALLSGGDHASHGYRFHHYAVAVPFLVTGAIYGAAALRRRHAQVQNVGGKPRRPWQGEVFLAVGITLIFNVGLVDTPLNPQFWMGKANWGKSAWRYGQTPRDRFKDRWLAQHVPDGVPIAANEFLAPHLTRRGTLGMVRYPDEDRLPGVLEHVQYVVADGLHDYAFSFGEDGFLGGALHDLPGIRTVMAHPEFELVAAQDGLLLFGRNPAPGTELAARYTIHPWQDGTVRFDFGGRIGLLSADIKPLGERRFRLHYAWVALQRPREEAPYFAVSRLEGVAHSRIIHLPTTASFPTAAWKTGEVVEEVLEVVLPPELPAGTYRLWTGWYDAGNIHSAATDARSRLGEETYIGLMTLGE